MPRNIEIGDVLDQVPVNIAEWVIAHPETHDAILTVAKVDGYGQAAKDIQELYDRANHAS